MSVTVVNKEGVTLITVVEDRNSMLPPLCQILKTLCFSPMCCSVKSGMMQTGVTAALGTVQIMVGLFNIGLGPGRTSLHPRDFSHIGAAYWLGGVFLVSGIISVLAGRFPSVGSVIFAVIMNILGAIFSIVGIVLYSIDLSEFTRYRYSEWFFRRMMIAMDITMLILIVLQLCVCISFVVLGVKPLINKKTEKQVIRDVEIYKNPELMEVLLSSPDP